MLVNSTKLTSSHIFLLYVLLRCCNIWRALVKTDRVHALNSWSIHNISSHIHRFHGGPCDCSHSWCISYTITLISKTLRAIFQQKERDLEGEKLNRNWGGTPILHILEGKWEPPLPSTSTLCPFITIFFSFSLYYRAKVKQILSGDGISMHQPK